MALFKKQEKAQSPPPAIIHRHEPSPFAEMMARVVGGLVAIVTLWLGGEFLLTKVGIRDPDRILAEVVLWLLGGGPVLVLTAWGLNHLLDRWLSHREQMADKLTEQLRYRQLMQHSAVVGARRSGTDARLAALVIAIMMNAFDHHARRGQFRGQWRPWSRRAAAEIVLAGESAPVGEAMARKARAFLERHQVVVDGQLNLDRYPDLASIQRLLYDPPLVVIQPDQRLRVVK